MTVKELKKLIEFVDDDKKMLVERLDIDGEPIRNGARCYPVDRTEELKKTFVLGIYL